jgi:hypothetical protein
MTINRYLVYSRCPTYDAFVKWREAGQLSNDERDTATDIAKKLPLENRAAAYERLLQKRLHRTAATATATATVAAACAAGDPSRAVAAAALSSGHDDDDYDNCGSTDDPVRKDLWHRINRAASNPEHMAGIGRLFVRRRISRATLLWFLFRSTLADAWSPSQLKKHRAAVVDEMSITRRQLDAELDSVDVTVFVEDRVDFGRDKQTNVAALVYHLLSSPRKLALFVQHATNDGGDGEEWCVDAFICDGFLQLKLDFISATQEWVEGQLDERAIALQEQRVSRKLDRLANADAKQQLAIRAEVAQIKAELMHKYGHECQLGQEEDEVEEDEAEEDEAPEAEDAAEEAEEEEAEEEEAEDENAGEAPEPEPEPEPVPESEPAPAPVSVPEPRERRGGVMRTTYNPAHPIRKRKRLS